MSVVPANCDTIEWSRAKHQRTGEGGLAMPLTQAEIDQLDDYQFMMGEHAGKLALVLDQLTDVMAMVGQHKTHCRVEKGPRTGAPPLDIVELLSTLQKAKGLVQQTLLRLKEDGPARPKG